MKRLLSILALCLAIMGFGAQNAAADSGLVGTFVILEGRDYRTGYTTEQYGLQLNDGTWLTLNVSEAFVEENGGEALDGQVVSITLAGDDLTPLELQPIHALQPATPEPQAVTGSQPFAWILCQFPGDTSGTSETRPINYFQGMYSSSYPGLDHYWRQVSYNSINIVGSAVLANGTSWLTMPASQSSYMNNGSPDLIKIFDGCTAAARNAGHNLSAYEGLNLILDEDIGCCAWGGTMYDLVDGRIVPTTWEPPWAWKNIAVFSHEMGHAFGLPHSNAKTSSTDNNPYDNPWDVMSGAYTYGTTDSTYGVVGVDTNAAHKDALGWMNGRKVTFNGGAQTIALEALNHQTSGAVKMIQIPGSSPGQFYTVEARQQQGYDSGLPQDAVIIYEIDTGRTEPAWIQGTSTYVDPTSGAVRWTPGETWTSPQGISVEVVGTYDRGFSVCVAEAGANCGPFRDVPSPNQPAVFEQWIEDFYQAEITGGCNGGTPGVDLDYCPEDPVSRGAMAVFILRALNYPNLPHSPTGDPAQIFADVPSPNQPASFELWIEDFYNLGITTGCGQSPLIYCPEDPVSRGAMAVFILRALEGSGYTPQGDPNDPFVDVPSPNQPAVFEDWIEDFYARGITTGCNSGQPGTTLEFCPEDPVSRGAMAVFILRAFDSIPDPDDP